MSFQHGKDTVVTLDSKDLSAYTTNSAITSEVDSHDVTTYGDEAHDYQGGLDNGSASLEGIYDNTATTGPRPVITGVLGSKVTFVRQPEGAGSGKPQDSVTVLVTNYVETAPVADMIAWSCEMQLSSVVDRTAQV